MRAILFLIALLLATICIAHAANPVLVDVGTATDGCVGGLTFLSPNAPEGADDTLRFNQTVNGQILPFSCKIAAESGTPYAVDLTFLEPTVVTTGQRIFSVQLNGLPMVTNLDLVKAVGPLVPVHRYAIGFPVDGFFTLIFSATVRSAVVTTITLTPLAAFPPNFTYTIQQQPVSRQQTSYVAARCGGCQGWLVMRPIIETDSTVQLVYSNVAVYRNGIRQVSGVDMIYDIQAGQIRVQPLTAWAATDLVLVDYVATWPLPASPLPN